MEREGELRMGPSLAFAVRRCEKEREKLLSPPLEKREEGCCTKREREKVKKKYFLTSFLVGEGP